MADKLGGVANEKPRWLDDVAGLGIGFLTGNPWLGKGAQSLVNLGMDYFGNKAPSSTFTPSQYGPYASGYRMPGAGQGGAQSMVPGATMTPTSYGISLPNYNGGSWGSSYQNIGRGPSVPSVSGFLSGGMGGNYTGNARGGSSGQVGNTGYEQGRPVAPQQQAQRPPRSFLGGLVGRDYHLLQGNG